MNPGAFVGWIVAFVLLAVVVTGLARRVGWSAPVLLVVVGAGASFIPAVPEVHVEPEWVLYGVVPPLLFAAAFGTYAIDVRARRDTIVLLSVGLVVFTAFAVGWITFLLLPAVGFAAAFAFAAVVAPTDASAVTAIAGRLKLPHRVVTVLEGESLLNDATALVLLNTAIAAIVSTTSPGRIATDLALAVVGGVGVGLAVGWLVSVMRSRLRSPVLDTSLALITPYFAFLAADAVLGSGVLAVVISALYLGFRSPTVQSAEARVAEAVNWRTVSFLVENAVFLFIGLNAAGIIRGSAGEVGGFWATAGVCAAVVIALFLSRSVFVFVMVGVFKPGSRYLRAQDLRWKYAAVVSAANVRGVVTLAAIFLLPPQTPARAFLQLMAFVVVVVSLFSGIILPPLIRRLHLAPEETQEFVEWQRLMAEAHATGLKRLESEATDDDHERVLNQLRANATLISDSIEHETDADSESFLESYRRLRRIMIHAERQYVIGARRRHAFPETVVAAALRAIDIEEMTIRSAPVLEDAESSPQVHRGEITPRKRVQRHLRRTGDQPNRPG